MRPSWIRRQTPQLGDQIGPVQVAAGLADGEENSHGRAFIPELTVGNPAAPFWPVFHEKSIAQTQETSQGETAVGFAPLESSFSSQRKLLFVL
jgi:hypothetical protein